MNCSLQLKKITNIYHGPLSSWEVRITSPCPCFKYKKVPPIAFWWGAKFLFNTFIWFFSRIKKCPLFKSKRLVGQLKWLPFLISGCCNHDRNLRLLASWIPILFCPGSDIRTEFNEEIKAADFLIIVFVQILPSL